MENVNIMKQINKCIDCISYKRVKIKKASETIVFHEKENTYEKIKMNAGDVKHGCLFYSETKQDNITGEKNLILFNCYDKNNNGDCKAYKKKFIIRFLRRIGVRY